MEKKVLHIHTEIKAPIEFVWEEYNNPQSIMQWNQASPDWHCPSSENDLRVGGRFKSTMAAKDGSFSFDFGGLYTEVNALQKIAYCMDDNRTVDIQFDKKDDLTTAIEVDFVAEETNPVEMQQEGWQAILNSFKKHTEQKYGNT